MLRFLLALAALLFALPAAAQVGGGHAIRLKALK